MSLHRSDIVLGGAVHTASLVRVPKVNQCMILANHFYRSLTYEFILNLPITTTLLPICLPTFYLWIVDTFALKRGTWVIDAETKSDLYLWNDLELE